MILVVTVKLFGFLRAITRYVERLISHKATFTMLRDIRVQFFGKLVNVIPNVYRKLSSSDLISRMISRVEALQNIYLRVYYPPVVIGLTALVTVIVLAFISIGHALLIMVSMLFTLLIVPWLSSKKARTLKKHAANEQARFLNHFYDYKAGMDELRRFNQINHYRDNLMAKLNHFDKLQLKEQRFLTIYDFILNIIAMLSIFGSLVLGLIQINAGQLNIIYMTSIVLMILTLFEQAVPMTNVAYYKADTDQALHDINEVYLYLLLMEKNVLMISMMQRTFMKLRMLVLSIGISKRMCCRILILMLIEAKRLRLWVLQVQEKVHYYKLWQGYIN